MDYERENAKEWQMPGTNPGYSEQDRSDDGYSDYTHVQDNDNNVQEETTGSEWHQVSYKRPAAKAAIRPKERPVLSKSTAKTSARPKLPPPPPPPVQTLQNPRIQPQRPIALATRPPPRITFSTKIDNPARAAFRAHKPHTGTFELTKMCHLIEPDRGVMYGILEEIGVRLESYIRPPQHLRDLTLLLWGNDQQIASTKEELKMWIKRSEDLVRAQKSPNFARGGQLSQEKAISLDKKIRRDAAKQKFQKAPDPKLTFGYIGYFLWPVAEIRPEDLLGPSYEAFDPIRMLHTAYIVFDNQYSVFKIMSDKNSAAEDTIKRIEGTMKEYVARSSREITLNIVEPPRPKDMRKKIKTTAGAMLVRSVESSQIPTLTGPSFTELEMAEWEEQSQILAQENFEKTHATIRQAIARLRYYRGRVRMRVLLGTFALTTFRRLPEGVSSIPYERFLEDMKLSAVKGCMIKDLQLKTKADIMLAQICNANGIFAPADVLTTALEDVAPVYTARFEFDIPGTGRVQLEHEMGSPGMEGLYEATHTLWTRISDKAEAAHPMEVFVIRLQGGISWEIQISTSNSVDPSRVTPKMTAFANNVRFKRPPPGPKPQISGHKAFFWTGGLPIIRFEQKTALRYRLVDDVGWNFEFARYDSYGSPSSVTPTETQWGATFWSSEWDRALGDNAGLGIGQAANWEPKIETFFPKMNSTRFSNQGGGLKMFIQSVTEIVELFDEVDEDRLGWGKGHKMG